MQRNKKASAKVSKKVSSIRVSINGAIFEASGDAEEVSRKFSEWLEQTLTPMGKVLEICKKELDK